MKMSTYEVFQRYPHIEDNLISALYLAISTAVTEEIEEGCYCPSGRVQVWMNLLEEIEPNIKSWVDDQRKKYE